MTRENFINTVSQYCSINEAKSIANGYTDDEIRDAGEEIISEIAEEYRYQANIEHYRNHGY